MIGPIGPEDTALVFTAHRRPYYMKPTLKSWTQARGYSNLRDRHVFLDPGDRQDEMLSVFAEVDPFLIVHVNDRRHGVLGNPWNALDYAFSSSEVQFAILAEEDLEVSPDVLEYFAFAMNEYSPNEALGVCAYNSGPGLDVGSTHLRNTFDVWIWGLWRESWFSTIRDTWDFDYSTNNGIPGADAGWDHNINRLTHAGKPFVYSEITHSRHTGRLEGSHMQEQWFSQMQPSSFDIARPEGISFYRQT